MTKAQKKSHAARLRSNARMLRSLGHEKAAKDLERGADEFEETHKLTKRRRVEWLI